MRFFKKKPMREILKCLKTARFERGKLRNLPTALADDGLDFLLNAVEPEGLKNLGEISDSDNEFSAKGTDDNGEIVKEKSEDCSVEGVVVKRRESVKKMIERVVKLAKL